MTGTIPAGSVALAVGKRRYDSFGASAWYVLEKQKSAQRRKSKWKLCRALCVSNVPEIDARLSGYWRLAGLDFLGVAASQECLASTNIFCQPGFLMPPAPMGAAG